MHKRFVERGRAFTRTCEYKAFKWFGQIRPSPIYTLREKSDHSLEASQLFQSRILYKYLYKSRISRWFQKVSTF